MAMNVQENTLKRYRSSYEHTLLGTTSCKKVVQSKYMLWYDVHSREFIPGSSHESNINSIATR